MISLTAGSWDTNQGVPSQGFHLPWFVPSRGSCLTNHYFAPTLKPWFTRLHPRASRTTSPLLHPPWFVSHEPQLFRSHPLLTIHTHLFHFFRTMFDLLI